MLVSLVKKMRLTWIFLTLVPTCLSVDRRPNILYILADDLGWADVSWHNPEMVTPVLEGMASQGVILDNFYTQPKCSPSRAALMTGLYPYKMSMQRGAIGPFRPTGLPTHLPILPQLLKQENYTTHLVGKWHLGYCNLAYTPTERGFDTFFGEYAQQADHYSRQHEVNLHIGSGYDLRRRNNVSYDKPGMYSTQLWEEETTELLDVLATSPTKPWYIQLSLTAAHPPYQVPERFMKLYEESSLRAGSPEENDLVRKGMVSAIDESVGRIMDKLRSTGLYEDTIVVFTSDNGSGHEPANRPLRGRKGSVYEGGVRVPAFVHGPPLVSKMRGSVGYTSQALAHITDMFPTLLGVAGHKLETSTDGVDLWPALVSGSNSSGRSTMVYNIDMDDQSGTFQFAVRRDQWKLIWGQTREFKPNQRGPVELSLFDLAQDPLEQRDLAGERGDKVLRMKGLVKALAKEIKVAFQPNRYSLGFPRYHSGLLEPGWCPTGWWDILWDKDNHDTIKDIINKL